MTRAATLTHAPAWDLRGDDPQLVAHCGAADGRIDAARADCPDCLSATLSGRQLRAVARAAYAHRALCRDTCGCGVCLALRDVDAADAARHDVLDELTAEAQRNGEYDR